MACGIVEHQDWFSVKLSHVSDRLFSRFPYPHNPILGLVSKSDIIFSQFGYFQFFIATTNAGLIALGLDLLCRNCNFYIDSTKTSVTRNKASKQYDTMQYMGRATRSSFTYDNNQDTFEEYAAVSSRPRRMNAWQQRQNNSNMYLDD